MVLPHPLLWMHTLNDKVSNLNINHLIVLGSNGTPKRFLKQTQRCSQWQNANLNINHIVVLGSNGPPEHFLKQAQQEVFSALVSKDARVGIWGNSNPNQLDEWVQVSNRLEQALRGVFSPGVWRCVSGHLGQQQP